MKNQVFKVNFETVTPLCIGNAWMKKEPLINASSLIGCLRYWFEVICYLNGITTYDDYKSGNNRSKNNKIRPEDNINILRPNIEYKDFRNRLLESINKSTEENKNQVEIANDILLEMKIPLPARVFGCTGWQGLIKIKEIDMVMASKEFGKVLDIPPQIYISKTDPYAQILRKNDYLKKNNDKYSVHYFPRPSFYGKFNVTFSTDEKTAQYILFPLLKFVEYYGFIGCAWNSGYGRVKIWFEDSKQKYDRFVNYAEFSEKPLIISDLIEKVDDKNNLKEAAINPKSIKLFTFAKPHKDVVDILEELVKEKVYFRRNENNCDLRHQIFGTTKRSVHGSKVLPWVCEASDMNTRYNYGFISIVDLFSM